MKLLVVLLLTIFVLQSEGYQKNRKNDLRKYRIKERKKYNNRKGKKKGKKCFPDGKKHVMNS